MSWGPGAGGLEGLVDGNGVAAGEGLGFFELELLACNGGVDDADFLLRVLRLVSFMSSSSMGTYGGDAGGSDFMSDSGLTSTDIASPFKKGVSSAFTMMSMAQESYVRDG